MHLFPDNNVPNKQSARVNKKNNWYVHVFLNLIKNNKAYGKKIKNLCTKDPAISSSPNGPDNFLELPSNPKISLPKMY